MTFADAIGLRRGDTLALVGAGGKTTLTILIGLELLARGEPVVCCATTMTLLPAPHPRVRVVYAEHEDAAQAVAEAYASQQLPWVAGRPSDQHDPNCRARTRLAQPIALTDAKIAGVSPAEIDRIRAALPQAILILEADGARHRWLKAPAEHEPQLPASTTILAPMAHLGVIGKPLGEEHVHRPERVARILGVALETPLTPKMVAAILTHPDGGMKGWRPGMRFTPILTLAAPDAADSAAAETCQALLAHAHVGQVILAWLGEEQPWMRVVSRE